MPTRSADDRRPPRPPALARWLVERASPADDRAGCPRRFVRGIRRARRWRRHGAGARLVLAAGAAVRRAAGAAPADAAAGGCRCFAKDRDPRRAARGSPLRRAPGRPVAGRLARHRARHDPRYRRDHRHRQRHGERVPQDASLPRARTAGPTRDVDARAGPGARSERARRARLGASARARGPGSVRRRARHPAPRRRRRSDLVHRHDRRLGPDRRPRHPARARTGVRAGRLRPWRPAGRRPRPAVLA